MASDAIDYGRRLLLVASVLFVLPSLLGLLFSVLYGRPVTADDWMSLVLSSAFAFFLSRGCWWAHAYAMLAFLAAFLFLAVGPLLRLDLPALVALLPLLVIYLGGYAILWRSETVSAFVASRDKRRIATLDLSGNDD